jgi:hypothetical protein
MLETKLPSTTLTRYYEIYVNKLGIETPVNLVGIVKVLNESDDVLINSWCFKKIGPKWMLRNKNLIKS